MAEGEGNAPSSASVPGAAPVSPSETRTPSAQGQTPASSADSGVGDDSPDEVKDAAALLRNHRTLLEQNRRDRAELARLREAAKQAEDAKLSETERLSKRVAELEATDKARATTFQEKILAYEIKLHAKDLSIVDPDAAAKLVDLSQIDFDAQGMPQGVDRALKALVKDKPYLVATAPGAAQPTASPTNPATRSSSATATRRYSAADLDNREFYLEHRDDIIRAHREGRIDP